MSNQVIQSDLLADLSTEEQEHVSGGYGFGWGGGHHRRGWWGGHHRRGWWGGGFHRGRRGWW
ncbi:hypothetical protein [Nostoc sp. CCY0012]|uniref:hypothetical protein n=1 Tax=Nostoc sp. CCY0012 TaxID=1056123 RepID=UPI0039C5DAB6